MFDLMTLREAALKGQRFDYLLFYGHKPRTDGTVGSECLSQWYGAGFSLDGVRYATAEHFMMAGKARLFGDDEMLAEIVDAAGPSEAKKLGRQVRNFDDKVWKQSRFDIVVAGSKAKFEQNDSLREYLLSTGDRVLVEAAPRDRIWGIGMGKANPAAQNPKSWRGQNLLGFALMRARAAIRGGN
jgi:ribA/ribD-fused uncharacterized protein